MFYINYYDTSTQKLIQSQFERFTPIQDNTGITTVNRCENVTGVLSGTYPFFLTGNIANPYLLNQYMINYPSTSDYFTKAVSRSIPSVSGLSGGTVYSSCRDIYNVPNTLTYALLCSYNSGSGSSISRVLAVHFFKISDGFSLIKSYELDSDTYSGYVNKSTKRLLGVPSADGSKSDNVLIVSAKGSKFTVDIFNQSTKYTYSFDAGKTILSFDYTFQADKPYNKLFIASIQGDIGNASLRVFMLDIEGQSVKSSPAYKEPSDISTDNNAEVMTIKTFPNYFMLISTTINKYFVVYKYDTGSYTLTTWKKITYDFNVQVHDVFYQLDVSLYSKLIKYNKTYMLMVKTDTLSNISEHALISTSVCLFYECTNPDNQNMGDYSYCRHYCEFYEILEGTKCSRCPLGKYAYQGQCITSCPTDNPDLLADSISRACYKCSDIGQASYNGKCYSTCPDNTIAENGACVPCVGAKYQGACLSNGCPSGYGYDLTNKTCAKCEAPTPIAYNGFCYSTCPAGVYWDGKTCIFPCPGKQGGNRNTGKCENCSSSHQYNIDGVCVAGSSLPVGYVVTDPIYNIITSCAAQNMVIFNNSCVASCPSYAIYEKSLNICLNPDGSTSVCDVGFGLIGGNCVKCQSAGKTFFNYNCIDSCPEGTGPNGDGICMVCAAFSDDKYYYNGQCVSNCPAGTTYDGDNNICLDCSLNGQVAMEGKCVDHCEEPYGRVGNICYVCRNIGSYFYQTECVSTCPANTEPQGSNCEPISCSTAACNGGTCQVVLGKIQCSCGADWLGKYCRILKSDYTTTLALYGNCFLIFRKET
jgi:hypothetical protein